MKNRKGLSKMRCPRCDANVSDTATLCTFCGQNLSVIHYIRRVSNTYYNLGLEKAKVRDLSGAIVVLKKSLEFNKKNTNARNLLGLIYYEMGETVAALSEWVLSKYLQADDNAADYYINTIQKNQTALDATNQTIKKYNSALAAAQAGNDDLAIIQLKKVVSLNPHFVRAQQLLALLYIHDKDYHKAAKCLNRARRIDFNNTTTLRYMQEVGDLAASSEKELVKKPSKKDPLSNVTPVGTYKEEKRSLMPVIYVIIGAIVGLAVAFVLLWPTMKNSGSGEGSHISDTNDQLAVQSSQISGLKKEKELLQEQVAVGLGSRIAWKAGLVLYAQWTPWTDEADFIYKKVSGFAVITGYSGKAQQICIPPSLGGLPVRTIRENAFADTDCKTVILSPPARTLSRAFAKK